MVITAIDCNAGYGGSSDCNDGYGSSGDCNVGDEGSGDCNAGDEGSGDSILVMMGLVIAMPVIKALAMQ